MSTSLRSRLWLSYALVVLAALVLTAVILILSLLRSPVAYRQTYARLEAVQELLLSSNPGLTSLPPASLGPVLRSADKTFNVRILVYTAERTLAADSRASVSPALTGIRRAQVSRSTILLRDETGGAWLFSVSKQPDGKLLLVGAPRPRIAILALLTNDIFPSFVVAGLAALALSLLAAFGLARWIGAPLQTLVDASRRMPHADARPVTPSGPREIQDLTRAFNDMSARMQASQKSQREFVANVSHELKTPLTSIQGFAQALQDGTADTDESRRHAAQVIQEEAGRMHRLVLDLLDLARLDAGTADLQRAPLDLPALLHSVAEKFDPQARAAGVTIRVEMAALPAVTGDGDRLAQVFTNLVDNALAYTPAGGSITLRAAADGSTVRVEVADTGAGIPADALAHIFDRFYQADPSRPGGRKHGAGLGLAIAREIAAAHGGTISVRSEPGAGSTFTVSLPLTTPEASTVVSKRKK
ncbi:MAG: two-component sensor histidine kinase [Anaerolineaceae bacterium]|nr:MAG: two-component sensor histidine kinase [Anaerolineaceae bacterium]